MLKYQISLCNVWWNKNDINTRYFDTTNDQITYFETLTGGEYSPLVNFNMGDFIETTVIYKDSSSKTPEQLVRSNYAVVKRTETTIEDDVEVTHVDYRFFFAKCYQDSGRQMRVDLSLDDIQTNYFKYKTNIAPCLINRAHLNRWIQVGVDEDNNKIYSFDNRENSLLFKNENANLSKRMTDKLAFTPKWTGNTTIDNWLFNNVGGWLYVYINNRNSDNDTFTDFKCYAVYEDNNSEINTRIINVILENNKVQTFTNINYGVLVYPLYKTNKKIKVRQTINNETIDLTLSVDDLNNNSTIKGFKNLNKNSTYILNEKVSFVCPFTNATGMTIENDNLILTKQSALNLPNGQINASGDVYISRFSDYTYKFCSISSCYNKKNYELTSNLVNPYLPRVTANYVMTSNHSYGLNPKCHSSEVISYKLHANGDEGFDYDPLKLGNYLAKVTYSESLQPEITRYFARFKIESYTGVLSPEQELDFIGDTGMFDGALPVTNDKYSEFIANNKNYWLQQNANMVTSLVGGIGNVVTGNYLGAVSDVVNIANKGLQTWANADNMKNAPGSLKNASSNVLFALQVEDLNVYVSQYKALECDIKTFDDYINKYGFAVGIVDNISNYDNIRKYFNYIECQVEVISAPISDEEKDRLKQKLSAIRFWNSDTINYVKENYERSLENNG